MCEGELNGVQQQVDFRSWAAATGVAFVKDAIK